ncbi:hypothetical protein RB653_008653 [Dictyostelium firmibasis]|uniref:Lysosomal dipeptide transporter MFSD1 n=1 Tax=Dictyostelium firmibasis TaxID=79012 RepID=A0AAN7YWR6_9MYCE
MSETSFLGHAFRYFGLFFICLITLGSYYIYDIPAALQTGIESLYKIHNVEWNLLYSVYSFPNMIIVFFGGYFIDNVFGLKKGAIIFCCLVMAGQIIFSVSSNLKLFWLALVGRTIFGLGGESLSVAQSTFCATWFKGRGDINFAFAITLAFSRIGSAINFQISPRIEDNQVSKVPTAIWVGAIVCGVSFASCIILVVLDVIRGKKDKDDPSPQTASSFMDIIRSFKDIFKFPGTLWLINLSVVLFYVPLFVFVSICSDFFQSKYGISSTLATSIASVPYYSAVSSPIIGFIVDRTGHNIAFTTFSSALLVVAHGLFAFSDISVWAGAIFLGASYAFMAASIWVTIPCLVPSKSLGSAYGLAFACQNAAVASFGLIINAVIAHYNTNVISDSSSSCADSGSDINHHSNHTTGNSTSSHYESSSSCVSGPKFASPNAYHIAELIFFGLSCLCLLVQITIILVDTKNRWVNVPSAMMKQRVKDLNPDDEKDPLIN